MIELVKITKSFNAGKPNAFTALKELISDRDNRITVFRGSQWIGQDYVAEHRGNAWQGPLPEESM